MKILKKSGKNNDFPRKIVLTLLKNYENYEY
jgi:hypothetical protein